MKTEHTNVKPELRSVAVVSQPTTSLQLYVVHELVGVAARHEVRHDVYVAVSHSDEEPSPPFPGPPPGPQPGQLMLMSGGQNQHG